MSNEIDAKRALKDFQRAYEYKKKWMDLAEDDFLFALGRQWDDQDVDELKKKGVRALTINKIRPNIMLLAGIESQNRSDLRAFPEGKEDDITAEIATGLLKNVMKMAHGDYKVSESFEDGITCGECYLEPYIDYTYDLNGEMRIKKTDYFSVFPEPGFKEYDMSDANYVAKVTYDLTKDQIIGLFDSEKYPDVEKKLENIQNGKINLDNIGGKLDQQGAREQKVGYKDGTVNAWQEPEEPLYDLLEYYYKNYVDNFFIAESFVGPDGQRQSRWTQAPDQTWADNYVAQANQQQPGSAKLIKRRLPEIWCLSVVGGEEIARERAWFYPKWKGFPFIPYFAYRSTAPIRSEFRDLAIQGIVRNLKDLNRELNKRRTQELRILGTTAASGWLTPKGAWVDRDKVEKLGSMPGVNLEYNPDKGIPVRLEPPQLSTAHSAMVVEHTEDMKQASGINADLLALQEGGQSSGRAIMLRQKQGMVMIQKLMDNLSQTKRNLGRFMLSQLSEIFTVEDAMRVMGEGFIQENFIAPVMAPAVNPMTGQPMMQPNGQPMMQPVVDPATGQPQMQVDLQAAQAAFNKVLTDTQLGKYDISVGENVSSETMQYGNYLMLQDLAQAGAPIPPDVLIQSSLLPRDMKKKLEQAYAQQAMAAQPPAAPKGK